ncbi:MAG: phosphoglycerate dehydrogenase [bacterium]|nr:phosphoglycerate dehydrogenase [bacterium]
MSPLRVLITTRSFRAMPGAHQQLLEEAGCEIVNSPVNRPLEAHELADLLPGIDGVILGVDPITPEVLERADRLRVISRYGIGLDAVDLAAATAKGIVVTNTPGGNTNAVAELTLAYMLALARNLPRHDRQIRQRDWSLLKGRELTGQTLGLIGMGRIGRRVAELVRPFNMPILFYDPYPPDAAFLQQVNGKAVMLDEVITSSDFISLHLPLSDQTRNLINADVLAKMKPGAFLVNTARGGLVDETALYDSLQAGRLGGAAFDAFAQEPAFDSILITCDNFIATPHIGSSTVQATLQMGLMASQNLLAVLRGERPEFVVNPAVYATGHT